MNSRCDIDPAEILLKAAKRLKPSDAPRYRLVIQELKVWVWDKKPWPQTRSDLLEAYRKGAISESDMNRRTLYTRVSRINALLDEATAMGEPLYKHFHDGFPVFKCPKPSPDQRRWNAYQNFVGFCFKHQIAYKDLNPDHFCRYLREPIKGTEAMLYTRYCDLRRFWTEQSKKERLKSLKIPPFKPSTRTRYGLSYDQWPDEWKDLFQRFQNGASGRLDSQGKLWKLKLSQATITNYKKSLSEFLGYLNLSGQSPENTSPLHVMSSPAPIRNFIEWHRDERCGGKSRDYHAAVVQRFAGIGEHLLNLKKPAEALADYAATLGGKPVHPLKFYEDMDYCALRDKAGSMLAKARRNFEILPPDAKMAERRRNALQYRDALLISFLLCRPLRSKNIRSLQVNQHIIRCPDGSYDIVIPAHEMKTRKRWDAKVTPDLVPELDYYIEVVLPVLVVEGNEPLLFPNKYGSMVSRSGMSVLTKKAASDVISCDLSVHEFRSLVTTLYLMKYPKELRTMRDLLGHKSVNTTLKHYARIASLIASRNVEPFLKQCCPSVDKIADWQPTARAAELFGKSHSSKRADAQQTAALNSPTITKPGKYSEQPPII